MPLVVPAVVFVVVVVGVTAVVDVVVELLVVVVVELVLVVVVVVVELDEKLIGNVTWSPAWSPNAITQESPAEICAAVGGQGKLAASVAALLPSVSVPAPGGPTTPVATVKFDEAKSPLPLVVLMPERGFVHETGTALPKTVTVG